jgi:hypothetical protein
MDRTPQWEEERSYAISTHVHAPADASYSAAPAGVRTRSRYGGARNPAFAESAGGASISVTKQDRVARPFDGAAASLIGRQFVAAREEALASGRPLMDVLQERLGMSSPEFVRVLAQCFQAQPVDTARLEASTPAFDVFSRAESVRHELVAVRDAQGRLTVVLSNPYGPDVYSIVERRIGGEFDYGIAHRRDVLAFLNRHPGP